MTTTQEEERRRISRDLHDGLGPSLASIGNRLRACQLMVDHDLERAKTELRDLAGSMKGHVQEVRELIHDLRPLVLDQLGLSGAVGQQVTLFSQESGVRASFDESGSVTLNPFAEVTVFRVVQECLSNVQKHAEATRVEVSLGGSLSVRSAPDGGCEITLFIPVEEVAVGAHPSASRG